MTELNESTGKVIQFEKKGDYKTAAINKIAKELETFNGGVKEKTVSKFVAATLTHFCEENERFAQILYMTPRTLSDCCAEVMDGCGNQISDIDVYRKAIKSYFPNSDISFKMEIQITGDNPSNEEIMREAKKKVPKYTKTKKSASIDDDEDMDEEDIEDDDIKPVKEQKPVNQAKKSNAAKTTKKATEVIQLSLFGEEI